MLKASAELASQIASRGRRCTASDANVCAVMERRIATASYKELPALTAEIAALYAENRLSDDLASALDDAISARRRPVRQHGFAVLPAPRRPPRSPDRQLSLERKRMFGGNQTLPPRMRAQLTMGEQAVVALAVRIAAVCGLCDHFVDQLAARVGMCRTVAQSALRTAARNGWIEIQERRLSRDRNKSNVITIRSEELRIWLRGRRTLAIAAKGVGSDFRRALKDKARKKEGYSNKQVAPVGHFRSPHNILPSAPGGDGQEAAVVGRARQTAIMRRVGWG